MGETCQLVQVSWERMIPALTGGDCDAIVASMSDTPARRETIDFSDPYYVVPVRFVGPADVAPGDTPDDLAGKVVGVQRGTINQTYMRAHYPATALKLYGNQEHVLLDLTLGRLDAVLGETLQLEAGFLDTPAGEGFAFFGAPHFDPAIQGEGAAIGVRKIGRDPARPVFRRDRCHPLGRQLPGDLGALVRRRHLRQLSAVTGCPQLARNRAGNLFA